MPSSLLSSLLTALVSDPALLENLISAIEGIFHHPAVQPNIPAPAPAPPSAGPVVPSHPGVLVPVPAPPAAFSPIPGKLDILRAVKVQGDNPPVPASSPYGSDVHFRFDNNLGNPLPWPKEIADFNPQYVYSWDGVPSTGPASSGSLDSDGYSGRFNIGSLHDTEPHVLKVALELTVNGQTLQGPVLTIDVQQLANN